jgi:hypothetical protein
MVKMKRTKHDQRKKHKNYDLYSHLFCRFHVLFVACIYLQHDFHITLFLVNFNSSTTGATSGAGTAYPSVFSGVHCKFYA